MKKKKEKENHIEEKTAEVFFILSYLVKVWQKKK